eukprot:9247981-Pyramimonas_sp.AAC.1
MQVDCEQPGFYVPRAWPNDDGDDEDRGSDSDPRSSSSPCHCPPAAAAATAGFAWKSWSERTLREVRGVAVS